MTETERLADGRRAGRAGDRVRHSKKVDWGIGEILNIDESRVEVFFVEAGHKTISLEARVLTILDPRPSHPLLDRMDAKAARGRGYRSISQSIKGFLESYPEGFYGDRYLDEERGYKADAHELAVSILGRRQLDPLAASGSFEEICRRAMRVVNKTNLIFPNEKMALKDGLKLDRRQAAFAVALHNLLHGEDTQASRFEHFFSVLKDMEASKWTVGTYFPFILYPDRHQFIKPTYTQNAAEICAFEISYTTDLSYSAYERMLRFSDYLKSELTTLKPRDNIDVQSFMWAIAQED